MLLDNPTLEETLRARGFVRLPNGEWMKGERAIMQNANPICITHKSKSPMAVKFELLWKELNGPLLTPEHRFEKKRKWRFDYAHIVAHVAIELEGGIHSGGRHNRAGGFLKDCEKYNHASADAWILFRLCTGMVKRENVEPIIACIRRRLAQS